ncbi:hypothetical protein LCGC14_2627770, partial [marine sediment metagenome]
MKPETVLKKAIFKAIKNGWDIGLGWEEDFKRDCDRFRNELSAVYRYYIFDHGFAKAFWGTKTIPVALDRPDLPKHIGNILWVPNW